MLSPLPGTLFPGRLGRILPNLTCHSLKEVFHGLHPSPAPGRGPRDRVFHILYHKH